MPATPAMRTLSLTRGGRAVRELTTMWDGRRKTFCFPYATNNQQEIDYLLSRGAEIKTVPVVLEAKSPIMHRNPGPGASTKKYEPLKGGEEK